MAKTIANAGRQNRIWPHFLVAACTMVFSLGACGSGGEPDQGVRSGAVTEAGWADGQRFSSLYSLQVLDGPGVGTVVIDTASMTGLGARVEARWRAGEKDVVAVDRARPALVFPWAWSGDDLIHVAGFACPKPAFDDIDLVDVDRVRGCGGAPVSYVIRSIGLTSREWTELEVTIPAFEGRTVDVLAAGPSRAIFSGADEADPSRRATYEVDLMSGTRTVLSGVEAGTSMCEVDSRWLGFSSNGTNLDGHVAPGRFVLVDDGSTIPLNEPPEESSVVLGCTDNGLVLWQPNRRDTVIARHSNGSLTQGRLPMPSGAAGIRLVVQRNLEHDVAIWVDEGESFHLWQMQDGAWKDCQVMVEGLDPVQVAAIIDCDVVTADPERQLLAMEHK